MRTRAKHYGKRNNFTSKSIKVNMFQTIPKRDCIDIIFQIFLLREILRGQERVYLGEYMIGQKTFSQLTITDVLFLMVQ